MILQGKVKVHLTGFYTLSALSDMMGPMFDEEDMEEEEEVDEPKPATSKKSVSSISPDAEV